MDMKYGPLDYWKLKSKFLEYQINKDRLQNALQINQETMNKILTESGYDTSKNWDFDDLTETIRERNDKSPINSKT